MNKINSDFIKDILLRYSIYFGILYLLYDNKLQIKTVFFTPYIRVLLFILIACFIVKFIETKTKFYFVGYFIKNILALTIIFFLFFYTNSYLLPFHLFLKKFFILIVLLDFVYILFISITCYLYKDIMNLIEKSDVKYLFSEIFDLLLNVCKDIFNSKVIREIYKLSFYNIDTFFEKQNSYIFIEPDEPIKQEKEDRLKRAIFVQNIKDVFEENLQENKGNVFLLSAGWGEGKTSCINLLKEQLNQKNIYEIIELNPWFNDTKEKLLKAFFGEINHFTKTNYPYKSLEYEFNDILKLSTIKIPKIPIEIDLNKFTVDKNIQNKIIEIGNALKIYSKRLIFVVDDVDRLEKNHILYILQVIQMFRQYTNIIFMLSCNYEKVEQILCEESEPCIQKKDSNEMIKKAAYYKDYLAKIITVPFYVPKAESYFIKKELLIKLNKIFIDESLINKENLKKISTEIFQTIRDIKRFYNHFVITYKNFDKRLDIFDFINLSILYVFYPELYNSANINRAQWFDIKFWNENVPRKVLSGNDLNSHEEEVKKSINNYFKLLLNKYNSNDKKCLKELFYLVSPVYYYANKSINYKKEISSTETSYFREKSFLSAYFLQYNFSVILKEKIEEWYKINE